MSTLPAFVLTCFLLSLAPGPSIAVTIRETLGNGRGHGVAATAGTETGILAWSFAAAFGLSALVAVSQVAYETIRIAGVIVLIGLGVQALWEARRPAPGLPPAPLVVRSRWSSYRAALATIAANPKGAVFATSFLPQFVPDGAPVLPTMLLLGAVWALTDGTWYLVVVLLVSRAREIFTQSRVRQRLEQLTGVVLIGIGLRLAIGTR